MNLTSYRLLLAFFSPLIAYSGWKRCRKHIDSKTPIKHCLKSRFGFNPTPFKKGGIWIHAVSVGETRSIFPLLNKLQKDHPQLPLTLTNGSTQGAIQALKFSPVTIQHQMIPYDFTGSVNRFLTQINPKLVIMVETEIWPNLYQSCHKRNIPIILINARLKEKSFLAYQKWGGKLVSNALQQTHFIASQFDIDTKRLLELGAKKSTTKTLGNLKFDIEILPGLVKNAQNWRKKHHLNKRFIWVAASTHQDEEELMLQAHNRLTTTQADALLILVPRHANRFKAVAKICHNSQFNTKIHSNNETPCANTQVFLADSVGELMHWFSLSDVAFIGGSLVPFGGHNILEPAALSKPILSGKWHQNLQAMYDSFIEDQAITIANNSKELAEQLIKLAESPKKQENAGKAAFKCFKKQTGALNKLMAEINKIITLKN